MHSYYVENKKMFRKGMNNFMSFITPELEKISGKKYAEILEEMWRICSLGG